MNFSEILEIAGIVFVAGGIYWQVIRLQRDFKGVSAKVNAQAEAQARQYHNLTMGILRAAPEEKQAELAGFVREE
jgi:hypothetical protein